MQVEKFDDDSYRALGRFLRGEKPNVIRTVQVDEVIDAAFRIILEGGDVALVSGLARAIVAVDEKVERLKLVELDRSSLRAALLKCVSSEAGDVSEIALAALEKSDALEPKAEAAPGTPS